MSEGRASEQVLEWQLYKFLLVLSLDRQATVVLVPV